MRAAVPRFSAGIATNARAVGIAPPPITVAVIAIAQSVRVALATSGLWLGRVTFCSVLHTWGQNLLAHPHVHCVVPAGGLSPDRTHWIHPRYPFFLPVHVLSRVFRGKFVAGLKRRFQQHQLTFAGSLKPLENEKAFRSFLRPLFRENWVVYAKPPFGGPHHVLGYLARYTHRVAITNHRLVAFQHDQVTFHWKDYAHGNKKRMMTLGSQEFLRRFLLHVLPRGFVRIGCVQSSV